MRLQQLFLCVGVALVLGSSTAAFADVEPANGENADVEMGRDIEVGTRLLATSDVKLRDVSLSKGSRVVVRNVESRNGRSTSVDVELADGHVLRHIDMGVIRKSFAVAAD